MDGRDVRATVETLETKIVCEGQRHSRSLLGRTARILSLPTHFEGHSHYMPDLPAIRAYTLISAIIACSPWTYASMLINTDLV